MTTPYKDDVKEGLTCLLFLCSLVTAAMTAGYFGIQGLKLLFE